MARRYAYLALAALVALGACSHGGSRHFGGDKPDGAPPTGAPPEEPPPNNPPPNNPPPNTPQADTTGTLGRTTEHATNGLGHTLHVGGNVVLGLGERTNLPLGQLGTHLNNIGDTLQNNGLGGVPVVGGALDATVNNVDGQLNGLAQVQLVNQPVLGATTPGGSQALGVSALSQTPSTGTLATVGILNQGAGQQPLGVNVGGAQLIGQPGPAAVNVGVLSNGTSGSPLGGVTSGLGGTSPLGSNPLSGVTAPLTNGGSAQNPVGSALNNLLGNH